MISEQNCIFCRIIRGEIPSVKLYEDDYCIVILDKFPATKGQSLVISKEHKDYIFNLDEETYNHLFEVAKNISKTIDNSLNTVRTCLIVEGFEVPHAHIRLHPAYEKRLILIGKEASDVELREIADKIKENL